MTEAVKLHSCNNDSVSCSNKCGSKLIVVPAAGNDMEDCIQQFFIAMEYTNCLEATD